MHANRHTLSVVHLARRSNGATRERGRDGIATREHAEGRHGVQARQPFAQPRAGAIHSFLHRASEAYFEGPERRARVGDDRARMPRGQPAAPALEVLLARAQQFAEAYWAAYPQWSWDGRSAAVTFPNAFPWAEGHM